MRSIAKQRGLSLIGLVMVLGLLGFFAFLFMRLFPVYSEYMSVIESMNAVAAEPGISNKSPDMIKASLYKRFNISYVESVKPEHIIIDRKRGNTMQIKYEVRKPLAYNLDFVAMFDRSVELKN